MTDTRIKRWLHRYRPTVAFYLDLGFLSVRTNLMYYAFESRTLDYLRIGWHLFAWKGEFDLFSPDERRLHE